MSLILRVLFMVLTTAGFYLIASHVLFLPNKATLNVIRHPHGKPTTEEQFAKALRPLTALLGRLFPMSEYKRTRYESDFARLGMTVSPQEYTSGKIARSLMLALLGLAFIPLGIPWLSILTCIAGILAYFQSDQKLRREIEKLNRAINAELPRMVGTMECTLGDNRDLIGFFSRYRRVAGKVMGQELDVLLTDLQTGNQELALRLQQPLRADHDPARRRPGHRPAHQPRHPLPRHTHQGARASAPAHGKAARTHQGRLLYPHRGDDLHVHDPDGAYDH